MKDEPVTVEKCGCGQKGCSKYGLSIGTFYQGCGFDLETATMIAKAINSHKQLVRLVDHFCEKAEYESEYDHRMEQECISCGHIGDKMKHAKNCQMVAGRKLLDSIGANP